MKQNILGIDIGGTKITVALVSLQRDILWQTTIATKVSSGFKGVLSQLLDIIEQTNSYGTPIAIGLGVPGPIDKEKGVIINAPHLGWFNIPIVSLLEKTTGIKTLIENDANAASLGELFFGAGQGAKDLIYITVSTGIGGGFIVNKRLISGKNGGAGELGHLKVLKNGPICKCGQSGCLEALSSGTAIARTMKEELISGEKSILTEMVKGNLDEIDTQKIYLAALKRDKLSLKVLNTAMKHLGVTVANLVNLFNPEMVLIGGGVSNIGDLLFTPVKEEVKKRVFPAFYEDLYIGPPTLKKNSGVLGAVAIVMQHLNIAQDA